MKVILAAFASSPLHMTAAVEGLSGEGAGSALVFTQIICTGSGFLVIEEDLNGETKTTTLGHCPLCVAAAALVLGNETLIFLSLVAFITLLSARLGLDRPRKTAPPPASFRSRAPPLSL
ncbi:MAG: hypothetical protein AAFY02_19070 [Pseudomonadota bacterium]